MCAYILQPSPQTRQYCGGQQAALQRPGDDGSTPAAILIFEWQGSYREQVLGEGEHGYSPSAAHAGAAVVLAVAAHAKFVPDHR